jgi:hypothetical protein
MKFGRWSWGYIPVALVLGLIWYESWKSGAFTSSSDDNSPADTQAAATSVAPPSGATGGPVVVEANPRPAARPAQPTPAGARSLRPLALANPASTPGGVIDDAFLNNPPPISISFSNATLDVAVDCLRQALGPNAVIQLANSSNQNRRFSVDMKNAPFWEVFKAMNQQSPVDLVSAPNYGKEGLILHYSGNGIYRILTNGPAILYPKSIAYLRQISGQDEPGTHTMPHYSLTLGAAVDPRIRVTRYMPVEVTEIVNEAGQPLTLLTRNASYSSRPSNYWESTVDINAIDPGNKRATLTCLLRFTAQLSESTVVIEDATHKVGESFMLGDRGLRLARFEVTGNQVMTQLQLDIPNPPIPINYTLTDANGRSMNFQTQSNQMRSVSVDTMRPPFKLTLHAPDQTREMSLPFELKDIPLP